MDYYVCSYCNKKTNYNYLKYEMTIKLNGRIETTPDSIYYTAKCVHCNQTREMSLRTFARHIISE